MRKAFPGYYRLSNQEFDDLWKKCVFVFDASCLLNIYRYPVKTSTDLLEIIEKIQKRIWLPYLSGVEFHRNRLSVISETKKRYEGVKKDLNDFIGAIEGKKRQHPYIEMDQIIEVLGKAKKEILDRLQTWESAHPDFIANDPLKDKIAALFEGRVGKKESASELRDLLKKGEERYKEKIPPGYEDDKKEDTKKYGDYIVWQQIINYSSTSKKPIIFITDDQKVDWWLKSDGKTISPRPELIEEFISLTGLQFHMYQTDQFIEHAEKHLSLANQEETIREVQKVKKESEFSSLVAYVAARTASSVLDSSTTAFLQNPSLPSGYPEILLRTLKESSLPSASLGAVQTFLAGVDAGRSHALGTDASHSFTSSWLRGTGLPDLAQKTGLAVPSERKDDEQSTKKDDEIK